MDESRKRCLVVVLGMHRGGTSAIRKSLELLGVGLGADLHPAGIDNPKGFGGIVSAWKSTTNCWHILAPHMTLAFWLSRSDTRTRQLFYNPKLRHDYANRLSPVEFEKQYFNRLESV